MKLMRGDCRIGKIPPTMRQRGSFCQSDNLTVPEKEGDVRYLLGLEAARDTLFLSM